MTFHQAVIMKAKIAKTLVDDKENWVLKIAPSLSSDYKNFLGNLDESFIDDEGSIIYSSNNDFAIYKFFLPYKNLRYEKLYF